MVAREHKDKTLLAPVIAQPDTTIIRGLKPKVSHRITNGISFRRLGMKQWSNEPAYKGQ